MNIFEKYLENNKKVEIKLISNNEVKLFKTGLYKNSSNSLKIYRPKENCDFLANEKIQILIYTKDGIFVFNTAILNVNSKIIEIQNTDEFKQIQRRDFLRSEIVEKFILKDKTLYTQTLSGGGLSFYYDEILEKNESYEIKILFKDRTIKTRIKIVEIRKNLKKELPNYRYSTKFISLNKSDENYIIKQCIIKNIETINF